jgi:hypothetical protein
MTTALGISCTIAELAERVGRSERDTLELVGPFLDAGILERRGDRVELVDRVIAIALGREEAPTP